MLEKALLAAGVLLLVVSGIHPHDQFTWLLEIAPILIAVPIMIATRKRFRFTPLVYVLVFVHSTILMLGGHYTYAEVPLGYWMKDTFHFARNHYDRIGHFAQGFIPALVIREIVVRKEVIRGRGYTYFFVIAACLAISALYELVEWWTAVLTSDGATAFLGTQGDPWDTQWDMFMCLVGSNVALVALSRLQDKQMAEDSHAPARELKSPSA